MLPACGQPGTAMPLAWLTVIIFVYHAFNQQYWHDLSANVTTSINNAIIVTLPNEDDNGCRGETGGGSVQCRHDPRPPQSRTAMHHLHIISVRSSLGGRVSGERRRR